MSALRARVRNGRLVLDVPTQFPEGTEFDLVIADQDDDLDAEERAALDSTLAQSWEQARAGQTRPVTEFLEDLKARR
jgi:hypothetical protein